MAKQSRVESRAGLQRPRDERCTTLHGSLAYSRPKAAGRGSRGAGSRCGREATETHESSESRRSVAYPLPRRHSFSRSRRSRRRSFRPRRRLRGSLVSPRSGFRDVRVASESVSPCPSSWWDRGSFLPAAARSSFSLAVFGRRPLVIPRRTSARARAVCSSARQNIWKKNRRSPARFGVRANARPPRRSMCARVRNNAVRCLRIWCSVPERSLASRVHARLCPAARQVTTDELVSIVGTERVLFSLLLNRAPAGAFFLSGHEGTMD